ncbi:Transcriptional activator protein Anr [Halomonas chromatireducens]|uniref:Transcriptional activator protein Anr n=1 Tax=Halomonas chromatireducens TaxID=507626 RepID=A0A109ULW2_9GAMM|nr:Transcriptional activator protein Anr [Halomonas chromatireducens]
MTSKGKIYSRDPDALSCLSCRLNYLCLIADLPLEERALFSRIVRPAETLEKRQVLASQGAAFDRLFAVLTGSLKQVVVTDSDEYIVTALCLPGDLVGLDAIGEGAYPGSLVALETTGVCEIPYEQLDQLCTRSAGIRRLFPRYLSQAMHDERLRLTLLLRRTAEVRLASFLLAVSERFRLRGYSPHHFRLALSRSDIASHLGLTPETVGRVLVSYQRQNLLDVSGHEFLILDFEGLKSLAAANGRRHRQREA